MVGVTPGWFYLLFSTWVSNLRTNKRDFQSLIWELYQGGQRSSNHEQKTEKESAHTRAHTHTHTHAHTHARTHTRTHAHARTHTHTHTQRAHSFEHNSLNSLFFNVALRPRRLYRLLGTGSPECPLPFPHSFWALNVHFDLYFLIFFLNKWWMKDLCLFQERKTVFHTGSLKQRSRRTYIRICPR